MDFRWPRTFRRDSPDEEIKKEGRKEGAKEAKLFLHVAHAPTREGNASTPPTPYLYSLTLSLQLDQGSVRIADGFDDSVRI